MVVDLVAAIRGAVDAASIVDTCEDSQCKVCLRGIGDDRIIVNLETHCENRRLNRSRCDFLLAENGKNPSETKLFLIEMGKKDTSTLKKQFNGGISIVNDIVPQNSQLLCTLVYARKQGMPRIEKEELRKATIRFCGKSLKIKAINCDDELIKALK